MQNPTPITDLLEHAYDPSDFRKIGHQVINLLADHLEKVLSTADHPVIPYNPPQNELTYWQKDLTSGSGVMETFENILNHSIHVHHPRYMGHQVAVPALAGSLAGLMSDLLSNGTGVYEMGMASNAIERVVTDLVARKIGYSSDASGLLTSGGSLANLTALLAARSAKVPDVWETGHHERLAVMVSEEAHYCIDRSARILGLGNDGIIKVPVDERFRIRTDLLDERLQQARNAGFHVFAVVGCASSTATGSYDDLNALADFSERNDIWFHVDGAHGGGVVFSERYRHLTNGINRADSVVIDFHKMLMTPALNTALIFKHGKDAYRTFEQRAQYLWDSQQSEEWYNSGKKTFECTKLMMAVKVYVILKAYGEEIFAQNIDRLFDLGQAFAALIKENPKFELAHGPEANIVNFRYINDKDQGLNELNARIRQSLIESGRFYIVQTMIGAKRYLRAAIMNPLTTDRDFMALLDEIEKTATIVANEPI